MRQYKLVISADEIPMIVDETSAILGRALTRKDGEAIVIALNETRDQLRERILADVTDAIEGAFDV